MTYKWSVFMADLNHVIGSEQQGRWPVLVISDETTNSVMPVVTILPVTSLKKGRRVYPNEALLKKGVAGLELDSIVLAHQIRTISKQRLMVSIGEITDTNLKTQIDDAMRVHLNL
jgi:mRNA interferase MazF